MSWRQILDKLKATDSSQDKGNRRELNLGDLEDRVLYSATPVPVPAETDGAMAVEVQTTDAAPEAQAVVPVNGFETAPIQSEELLDLVADSILLPQQEQADPTNVTEVVFVDSAVPDVDQLLRDLRQERGDDNGLAIITLDSTRNGIAQITAALTEYSDLDAIHIVSHGDDGSVQLGATTLSNDNFDMYANVISGWQNAMSDSADLLFYGCDLAASEDGRELLQSVSTLTGADVAASDDLTGHADLGGDWVFEYTVGLVETAVAFSEAVSYTHLTLPTICSV